MAHVVAEGILRGELAPLYQANPVGWFGPYYLGSVLDALFLGILSCQVSRYLSDYPKDSSWNKAIVSMSVILSVFKGVQSFCTVWHTNIVRFGDYARAASFDWAVTAEPLLMALLATTAQSYFAWRCFNLTGRSRPLLFFLGASMLASVAMGLWLFVQVVLNPLYVPPIINMGIPLLTLGLATDVTITSTVLYKLITSRGRIKKTAAAFLSSWIVITWQSALPPLLSQVANLAVFALASDKNGWHGFCNMLTPRLYVFSLMYTLNSRINPVGTYLEAYKVSTGVGETPATSVEEQRVKGNHVATLSTFQAGPPTFAIETSGSCTVQATSFVSPRNAG